MQAQEPSATRQQDPNETKRKNHIDKSRSKSTSTSDKKSKCKPKQEATSALPRSAHTNINQPIEASRHSRRRALLRSIPPCLKKAKSPQAGQLGWNRPASYQQPTGGTPPDNYAERPRQTSRCRGCTLEDKGRTSRVKEESLEQGRTETRGSRTIR